MALFANSTLKFFLLACTYLHSAVMASKLAAYWGQNSASSDYPSDTSLSEAALRNYCMDSTYDIIIIAFVPEFPTSSGSPYPAMDLSNHCGDTLSGTNLLDCPDVASDISYCQSQGKTILLSFGGADGSYGFTSTSQAQEFATTVWDMFLGGSGSLRPFGDVILDGIDLDIESGASTGYAAFVTSLRSYFVGASKPYYISSAPQCVYPDEWLGPNSGTAFSSAWFDYVWIQFYNNYCGLDAYPSEFNFDTWANWATTTSVNPNVQLFIGAPGAPKAAGTGYVSLATLETIVTAVSTEFGSVLGGVMLWDVSDAAVNSNFGGGVASFLHGSSLPQPDPPASPPASPPVSPATTGHSHPATTGHSNPATTGHSKNSKTSTSGSAPKSSTTTSNSKSHTVATTGSTSTTAPAASNPVSGSCVSGYMVCATSETYQTCAHGVWGAQQSCSVGLTCTPSGNYIYCE